MIDLFPPITKSTSVGYHEGERPMRQGPRFARSRTSGRWHRVRSGYVTRLGHVAFHFWCGSGASSAKVIGRDNRPRDLPVCGTCEGRAIGAGHDVDPSGRDLLFSPWRLTRPQRCPGSRTMLCREIGRNVAQCLVCGSYESLRAGSRGWWSSSFGLTSHETGPELVPGCPFHGWDSLVLRDGMAECRCGPPVEDLVAWHDAAVLA